MSAKVSGWRIWQKGLVMICVPLASELIFVSMLFLMLLQAQDEIRAEQHSRDLIEQTNELLTDYINVVIGAIAYRVTQAELDEKLFHDSALFMEHTLNSIRELTKDSPNERRQVADFVPMLNSTRMDCQGLIKRTSPEGLAGLLDLQKSVVKLSAKANHCTERIDQFLLAQENIEKSGPLMRSKARERIQFVVMAGIALNVFITVFLALYFTTEIAGRIRTLIENSLRFPAGKPLMPALQGSDELSEFDRNFRATVRRIEEAESFKKQLVGVISHELRTPLTSIDAIVSLLLAGGAGQLGESVIERLEKAEQNVSEVMSLVNDLLDIERMEAGKFPLHCRAEKISDLFEFAVKSVSKAAAEKQIMLASQPCEGSLVIDIDQMSKALTKMLLHCLELSSSLSTIKLEAHEREDTVFISVSSDHVSSENSPGQLQMFDKLQSLRYGAESRSSDILGLALCQAIVAQHRGSVGLDAESNKYWLQLPKVSYSAAESKSD